MNIYKYICLLLLLISSVISHANNVLIKQGQTELTFNDVDGFAFKMPKEIRAGYFNDPVRIDKALTTLLNYKLTYNYLKNKDSFNFDKLIKKVDSIALKLISFDSTGEDLFQKEEMYKKIKNLIMLEESYKSLQELVISNISDNSVSELAYEEYQLNRDKYNAKESRNLIYIAVDYNDTNKNKKFVLINEIKKDLLSKTITSSEIIDKYKDRDSSLIVTKEIKKYSFNKKQKEFSDLVFEPRSIGYIDKILDIENKYLIVNILKINPPYERKFSEVKSGIIEKLKRNKATRDFNNILLDLTKDPVTIYKDNILLLKTRYIDQQETKTNLL